MQDKTKRVISIIASLLLAMSMFAALPGSAFGATPPDLDAGDVCAIVDSVLGDIGYSNIVDAIYDAEDGDVIYLLTDVISGDDSSYIEIDKTLTIDMKGFDLTFMNTGIWIAEEGSLTIIDGGKLELKFFDVQGVLDAVVETLSLTDNSIFANNTAVIDITGDIIAEYSAIEARNGVLVTINGNITANDWGVIAYSIESDDSPMVIVNGDILAGICGVDAADMALVEVNGNITATDPEDGVGVFAIKGSKVEVVGDIDAVTGVQAGGNDLEGATVIVEGNITAKTVGIMALLSSEVFLTGNITVTDPEESVGVLAVWGSEVTIDGTISALVYYIGFLDDEGDDDPREPDEYDPTTLKAGYYQYTDSLEDVSYVWVKIPPAPLPPAPTTPGTGDSLGLGLLLISIISALGACGFLARRRTVA